MLIPAWKGKATTRLPIPKSHSMPFGTTALSNPDLSPFSSPGHNPISVPRHPEASATRGVRAGLPLAKGTAHVAMRTQKHELLGTVGERTAASCSPSVFHIAGAHAFLLHYCICRPENVSSPSRKAACCLRLFSALQYAYRLPQFLPDNLQLWKERREVPTKPSVLGAPTAVCTWRCCDIPIPAAVIQPVWGFQLSKI